MREILFRGKNIDNGEWVYGSFVMDATELKIRERNSLHPIWADGFIRRYDFEKAKVEMYEVDRETVGQYIGLLDKNGTKIFEGDVVKDMTVYLIHLGYEKQGLEAEGTAETYRHHGAVGVVQYNAEGDVGSCGCCFTQFVGAGFMAVNVDLPRCEVLGNIYDNPELMEKTKCSV